MDGNGRWAKERGLPRTAGHEAGEKVLFGDVWERPGLSKRDRSFITVAALVAIGIDRDKLRALGISSQSVMRAANTILTGTTIGQFRDRDKLIDIVMRQPVEERATITALNSASIPAGNGRAVPLSQLATPRFVWEPGVAWREGRDWAITVQSDVIDGVQGPTVSMQVDPELNTLRAQLPPGYQVKLAGAIADSGKAQEAIAANVPLVIFIVFTLLMLQLHSFSR